MMSPRIERTRNRGGWLTKKAEKLRNLRVLKKTT